jgi:excisionase family DNA binding protein
MKQREPQGDIMTDQALVTASGLEERGILKKGTAYRMAKQGHIPSYAVGSKGRGIRFQVDEVLAALRRPAVGGQS